MSCLICGCSEHQACVDQYGPCAWFVPGLCDFCVLGCRAPAADELLPLYSGGLVLQ